MLRPTEVKAFSGYRLYVHYPDHPPPHFHAEYGNNQMLVNIETLAVIAGKLPPRATGLVMEWAAQHRGDLRNAWVQARTLDPLGGIEPLP